MTNTRSPRTWAVAAAVSFLLLVAPLSAAAAPARVRQRKPKLTPVRIEVTQKDPSAVLRPGTGVTFSAKLFSRNDTLIEGGEVKWRAAGSTDVVVTQALDSGSTHEVTLIGFSPEGRAAKAATIALTASLPNGKLPATIMVPFRPNLTLAVRPAADSPNVIGPGDRYALSASVADDVGEVTGAKVKWELADSSHRDFVLLDVDGENPNRVTAVGLTPPKGKTLSGNVVAVATYGGVPRFATIPYKADGKAGGPTGPRDEPKKTAKVKDIVVTRKDGKSPFDAEYIEPGQRLVLRAKAEKADPKASDDLPEIVWEVPTELNKYIAKLDPTDDQKKAGEAVFYGLMPEAGEADAQARESLYVLVRAGEYVEAVPIRNGEQTVDVSWIVLPPDVVTKNFGRSISDKYYGIQVVIGNNSGNDLQLTGLSFEIDPSLVVDATQVAALRRMPVASYDVVRGVTEQRKLSLKSRGTIIAGLDAAAQILTGFTPFFNVATRARNFSHGINILSNPVTKGIERVWPDPLQDEMNRLEQQSLHDDRIITNRDVYRTTVFFPRDVLNCTSGAAAAAATSCTPMNPNDLAEVRRRLGQLFLVGSKLNRNDFQLRVRQGQGFRPASAATP